MIPLVIPPLSNLRVLVTRPAPQSRSTCSAIEKLGGSAIPFPVLDIKAREIALPATHFDLAVFVSAHAVMHGASLLDQLDRPPRIAVIGNATAAALQVRNIAVAVVAPPPYNSEALLQHEAMQSPPKSIVIFKGVGGRNVLRDTLIERGAQVDIAEVYERVVSSINAQARAEVVRALRDGLIDAVTITSVDVAQALSSAFEQSDLELIQRCAVIAGSKRIAEQLPALGWNGERIVSDSPDDESMLKALRRWHSRSRA